MYPHVPQGCTPLGYTVVQWGTLPGTVQQPAPPRTAQERPSGLKTARRAGTGKQGIRPVGPNTGDKARRAVALLVTLVIRPVGP